MRGVFFIVSTFRSILMKLLYINKFETIEKHMADTIFAIRTHVGITQRRQVKKTVMQGDIWAPLNVKKNNRLYRKGKEKGNVLLYHFFFPPGRQMCISL